MNSAFRARWLASSEVISQVQFTSEQPKKNKMAFVGIFSQDPITRSLQLFHILDTAFSQIDLFLAEFMSNSDPHGNLSDQLQLQARTNVDIFDMVSTY